VLGDDVLAAVEAALLGRFGSDPARASVSFLGVERVDVLRWRTSGSTVLATLGASRHPMGGTESMHVEPVLGPRAELVLRVRETNQVSADPLVRPLAVLAASPAVEGVVLRSESTFDLGSPLVPRSACTGFLLQEDAEHAVETGIGDVEAVRMLRAIPITANELAWARARGGSALWSALQFDEADQTDLLRRTVHLEAAG
jgi:hypothetical protein